MILVEARGLLLILVLWMFAGCSTMQGLSGERACSEPSPPAGPTYYTTVSGVAVHTDASAVSPVIAWLLLQAELIRTRVDKGYAFVTAGGGCCGAGSTLAS